RRTHPTTVALAVVQPYAFADPALRHHRSNPVDHTGAVAVRDHSRILSRNSPPAAISIRRIDARGLQTHAHFPGSRLRRGQLSLHDYFIRRTLPVIPNCPHFPDFLACSKIFSTVSEYDLKSRAV